MTRNGGCSCVTAVSVAVLSIMAWSADARAHCESTAGHCNLGYCNSTECEILCPTSADHLVFGAVWTYSGGWTYRGVGVVQLDVAGSYVDWCASTQSTYLWTVRADGGSSGGNGDIVRMATSGYQYYNSGYVAVNNNIPTYDSYLFWGDGGDDRLYLCSDSSTGLGDTTPTYDECPMDTSNSGIADGRDGQDQIYGGYGNDVLYGGGDGSGDYIYGYFGVDTIYGGPGGDHIYGGDLGDWIDGGDGNDQIWGDETTASDYPGADVIYGGAAADTIRGGAGADEIYGDDGSGTQYGDGVDEIHGEGEADSIWGGPGDDELHGGGAGDSIEGQGGNDTLYGNADCDHLDGGVGTDHCYCKDIGDPATRTGETYSCTAHDCTQDCLY